MTMNRPITTSFPLGLFCNATLTATPRKPLETPSVSFPLDRELLDMPAIAPETDGVDEGINWITETP